VIFKLKRDGETAFVKPYSIGEFVAVTKKEGNFEDMQNYTEENG